MGIENTAKGEVLVVNQKLYIPKNLRKELLQDLHSTHACAERMWKTIRSIWMWPALRNEIKSYVSQCPSCAKTARSKAHQPPPEIPEEMLVIGPMDRVGVDTYSI